jgi:hypothetical protein
VKEQGTGDPCRAFVGGTYSTGDPDDGLFPSADWSGPGRELRLLYTFSCDCGRYGGLHKTIEAAEVEARAHTDAVEHASAPLHRGS